MDFYSIDDKFTKERENQIQFDMKLKIKKKKVNRPTLYILLSH